MGCTDDSCNEGTDSCNNLVNDNNCADRPLISSCSNDPDNNPFTLDTASKVEGVCDLVNDCQLGPYQFSHDLIIGECGVNCLTDANCNDSNTFTNDSCLPDYTCENVLILECHVDSDCSGLDYQECSGDLVITNLGVCDNSQCITEEQPNPTDCNVYDVDSCGVGSYIVHNDYTCGVINNSGWTPVLPDGAACVLDNTYVLQNCDDGIYCNGAETCNLAQCVSGNQVDCSSNDLGVIGTCGNTPDGNPFTWDSFAGFTSVCDEVNDVCPSGVLDISYDLIIGECGVNCLTDTDCDDGNINTNDSCLPDYTCENVLILECHVDSDCDDGIYCNGAETCDGNFECQNDTTIDCNDNVGCTDDSCNEGTDSCDNLVDDSNCNDGLYCNGVETCDAVNDCQAGTSPPVNDNVACTDDSCDEVNDIIVNFVNNANCDDGAYCNGVETCDAVNDCQAGTTVDCSGNNLGAIGTCGNIPDSNPFTWDSFAGFTSVCDENAKSCTTGTVTLSNDCDISQCSAECESDVDCTATDCDTLDGCAGASGKDYYNYTDVDNTCESDCGCTDNSCGSPVISYNDASCTECQTDADCDDGVYCNGFETCDGNFDCQNAIVIDCNDNVGCTDDSCNEGTDSCDNLVNDNNCADLSEVNSCGNNPDNNPFTFDTAPKVEGVCDPVNDCQIGSYQFTHDCDISQCGAECESDTDCECPIDECFDADADGKLDDYVDYSQYSSCLNNCSCTDCAGTVTFDDGVNCGDCAIDSDCDDGLYCNGAEVCSSGFCQSGTDVGCSLNDVPGIATCNNDPDNNPFTLDYFGGFVSSCSEEQDACVTTSTTTLTHTCDKNCGAVCEVDSDCADSDKYTEDICLEECVCEYESIECFENKECYDMDTSTVDTCVNSGTTASYCSYRDAKLDWLSREKFFIGSIRTNQLVYDTLNAGDQLFVDLRFENIGRYDTNKATIRITVEELGISRKLGPFSGPDVDDVMSKGLNLDIPKDAEPGVYTVRISLSDLNGIRRTRHRDFRIV